MNKKAISYQMVMWIPRLVFLIIVLTVTFGLIFAFTATTLNVGDVESHILMHRLHFSFDGISKTDPETGRVYTGVVDMAKLDSGKLERALDIGEDAVAMRIERFNLDNDDYTAAYLHQNTYENWQPIAILVDENRLKKGAGRKFPYKEARYVFADVSSKLETVVIMPDE